MNGHVNTILHLRQRELAQSTRAFRARGGRAIRCDNCWMPQPDCFCNAKPAVTCRSAFCFLVYKGEAYRPSNSGRLIADVAPDNHAFLWQRTVHDPALLALLADPRYAPMVVFPHAYADDHRKLHSPLDLDAVQAGKIPLFVMLEGTWREAKKMFKSPYLASLPVLGIQPQQSSRYLMRDAAMAYQLCTAEVGVEVLKLAQEGEAAQALAAYFTTFCQCYTGVRPHLQNKQR